MSSTGSVILSVLAPIVGRIVVGTAAALVAVAVEAGLFPAAFRGGESTVSTFLSRAALVSVWVLVLLVPWSVLLRLSVGRAAAPWALLALTVVAAWLPPSGAASALRWLVPALPTDPSGSFVFLPASWGYAFAHAAAVTIGAASLLKRVG